VAESAYQIVFAGEAAEEAVYADVLELTVDEYADAAATLKLSLATTLDAEGTWTYLDDQRLALFAPVSVKVGFLDGGGLTGALGGVAGVGGNEGLVPVFDGYVTSLDLSLGSQTGQTSLDVVAIDASVLLGLEEKIATWTNLSDAEIIEHVVGGYGFQTEVDPTLTVHEQNDTIVAQRGTDLQFVRMLARRNGLEFAFETDAQSGDVIALCRRPQLDGSPQPDLAIQFGQDSNLTSFGVHVSGRQPLAVKVTQTDLRTKSVHSAQATAVKLTLLGADNLDTLAGSRIDELAPPEDARAQLLLLGQPTSDPTELQTLAQAVRDEAGWFITATGEINSDAYGAVLRPRRTVLVKGAGDQYSGTYYVTRVTHTLRSDDSYRQSFEARRNAGDLTGGEQFGSDGLGLPLPGF
jgi:phage protein D